jgi:diguanylate cyclase (GGDEF)-like protein
MNLITPAVFLFGAVLVLFIGTLALETAAEIKRMIKLEYDTVTDHLIGIYNRRYLDRKITEEIARSRRYGVPLSMMLLDIDHFKAVNDNYGHQIGDEVLKGLGRLLIEKIRDIDIIARYGGEEIAVLLPQTAGSYAFDLAERLRQAIEKTVMVPANENENNVDISITASIGVAEFDAQVSDSQIFIQRSDEALYQAKHEGRNRVIMFRDKDDTSE